jgi:hypothetical protein
MDLYLTWELPDNEYQGVLTSIRGRENAGHGVGRVKVHLRIHFFLLSAAVSSFSWKRHS